MIIKKVIILAKYLNYIKVILKKLVAKLFKYFNINKYIINLELGKYLFYELIYSLKLVKSNIFKIYININLINNFI